MDPRNPRGCSQLQTVPGEKQRPMSPVPAITGWRTAGARGAQVTALQWCGVWGAHVCRVRCVCVCVCACDVVFGVWVCGIAWDVCVCVCVV